MEKNERDSIWERLSAKPEISDTSELGKLLLGFTRDERRIFSLLSDSSDEFGLRLDYESALEEWFVVTDGLGNKLSARVASPRICGLCLKTRHNFIYFIENERTGSVIALGMHCRDEFVRLTNAHAKNSQTLLSEAIFLWKNRFGFDGPGQIL